MRLYYRWFLVFLAIVTLVIFLRTYSEVQMYCYTVFERFVQELRHIQIELWEAIYI